MSPVPPTGEAVRDWLVVRLRSADSLRLLLLREADVREACDELHLYTVGELLVLQDASSTTPFVADLRVDSGQKPATLIVDKGVKLPSPLSAPRPEWNGVAEIKPAEILATLGVSPSDEE